MSLPLAPRGQRWLYPMHAATAGFAIAGLAAMFALSPRVLYADPWRFVSHFLTTPWPWNVLAADNGHRELFPNMVRVLELQWLQANQWLQIVVGAALACATVAVLAYGIRREPVSDVGRAAALFFAVVGVFWLGNERSLAHGNESVHAYLVTLCLVVGCWLATDGTSEGSAKRLVAVVLLGAVATLSFGSGIACFVGYLMAMLLRRASWRQITAVAAGGIAMAALHLALGDAGVGAAAGRPSGMQLLRWLSAPFVYIAWPALDTDIAAQIPVAPVREACLSLAHAFKRLFGPAQTAIWPNALLASAGIGWLFWSTLAVWRRQEASRMEQASLGIAWFALAVGMLVCISRANYFIEYPQQVVAPRYLPWSSLFWSSLGMSTALRAGAARQGRVIISILLIAAMLAPSQAWMAMLAHRTQSLAEFNAVGAAVGVLAEDAELGENVPHEMVAALPLLRQSGKAMFAWPETRAMYRPPPAIALRMPVRELRFTAVTNRLGAPGYAVTFALDHSPCTRLLLADSQQVYGMAVRNGRRIQWRGWARQAGTAQTGVFAICQ